MAEEDLEAKANAFLVEANNVLGSSSLWWWLSFSSQWEDASTLFKKAGNQFFVAESWEKAASAYEHAAKYTQLANRGQNQQHAAFLYTKAANCHKKVSVPKAIACLSLSSNLYKEEGRYFHAANCLCEAATLYEIDGNLTKASTMYETAALYFIQESSTGNATECMAKVADYSAILGNFPKAIQHYEKVVHLLLSKKSLIYSLKSYFLHSGICFIAIGNMDDARRALTRYTNMCPQFKLSQEYNLLEKLVKSCASKESIAFSTACFEFDAVYSLDPWMVRLLLDIKQRIIDS